MNSPVGSFVRRAQEPSLPAQLRLFAATALIALLGFAVGCGESEGDGVKASHAKSAKPIRGTDDRTNAASCHC